MKDAEWIATCLLKDLIKGSYVPEDRIQQLRQYDRRIFDLNKEITYKLTKLDMVLQRCNIRISNYVATIDGKSYQEVVRLISEGKTSPEELAKVIHGRTVNKHGLETIVGALTGVISETDIDIIRQLREEILLGQKHKDECQSKMDELCQKWFPTQLGNLQTIPGVKTRAMPYVFWTEHNFSRVFPNRLVTIKESCHYSEYFTIFVEYIETQAIV